MTLSQRLSEYVRAAFTGIWIESHEHDDVQAEIGQMCCEQKWPLAVWDAERGLAVGGQSAPGSADPLAAIRSVAALAQPQSSALLVLINFHRFLQSAEIVQALVQQIQHGKNARTFILILAPVVQIPIELEKHFVVLTHDLPDKAQLLKIAEGIATEDGEIPAGEDLNRLLDAAVGLTRYEAEGAFSLSLVRHSRLQPDTIWELKAGMLKKSGLLTLHRGGERFEDLGGLNAIKAFCLRAMAGKKNVVAKPRGILLLGVPGTGKSAFARALGNETGRPTLILDIGALMGGVVGLTEQNTRQALRIVDAMAPCVCFVDELEKALSGVGSGQGDSGVSARLSGSLLSWLSDHESDVFFIATSNDISKLPPEFARSERFDAIWFLDLPSSAEKQKIWSRYLTLFQIPPQSLPKGTDWTGAEIRSCCRLASLLDLPLLEAAKQVIPVAVTASESVTRLRTWASGRCLDASAGGIYSREISEPKASRRVNRPESN